MRVIIIIFIIFIVIVIILLGMQFFKSKTRMLNDITIYDQMFKKKNQQLNYLIGENYLGMSPKINNYIKYNNWDFSNYSSENSNLEKDLSLKHNIDSSNILLNNGILSIIPIILDNYTSYKDVVICSKPSWYIFYYYCKLFNLHIKYANQIIRNNELKINFKNIKNKICNKTKIIYLIMPIIHDEFINFIKTISKDILIIIDCCYDDFITYDNKLKISDIVNDYNVIAIYSFSKFYALANLQIGYIITNSYNIKLIKSYLYAVPKFKENIAYVALNDKNHNNKIKSYYDNQKIEIVKFLKNNQINYIDSYQNYFYVKINNIDEYKKKLEDINIDYDYMSELKGYILFYIDSPMINNKILKILKNL